MEKKLAILEKALEANSDSQPLLHAYLNIAQRHLAPDQVLIKWAQAIKAHPTDAKLWKVISLIIYFFKIIFS